MFLAIFAVIIKGLVDIGSVGHILSVVEESGHIEFFKLVNTMNWFIFKNKVEIYLK